MYNVKNGIKLLMVFLIVVDDDKMAAYAFVPAIRLTRCNVTRTCAAAAVDNTQAPPAMVLLQCLHFQIPTACRFTVFLPQNVHSYLLCWAISILWTTLR
jgi:hypothetical protein